MRPGVAAGGIRYGDERGGTIRATKAHPVVDIATGETRLDEIAFACAIQEEEDWSQIVTCAAWMDGVAPTGGLAVLSVEPTRQGARIVEEAMVDMSVGMMVEGALGGPIHDIHRLQMDRAAGRASPALAALPERSTLSDLAAWIVRRVGRRDDPADPAG